MTAPHVLVIEDEDEVRDVWVDALEESGYIAVGLGSGPEALAWLVGRQPGLILLDLMMPDMDGIQFLARLRAGPRWTHIPVIIISGIGEDLLKVTGRPLAEFPGLRVTHILPKPISVLTLIKSVGRVIGPGATLEQRIPRAVDPEATAPPKRTKQAPQP